jgi:hypothetical protein
VIDEVVVSPPARPTFTVVVTAPSPDAERTPAR